MRQVEWKEHFKQNLTRINPIFHRFSNIFKSTGKWEVEHAYQKILLPESAHAHYRQARLGRHTIAATRRQLG